LKARLGAEDVYVVRSAGTAAVAGPVHPLIADRLRQKGTDPTRHVPRSLTRDLLETVDVPVAMGLDHREFIRLHFGRDVLLFNQICFQKEESVLDVHEALPDWPARPEATRTYILSLIDYIWEAMPTFLARLDLQI